MWARHSYRVPRPGASRGVRAASSRYYAPGAGSSVEGYVWERQALSADHDASVPGANRARTRWGGWRCADLNCGPTAYEGVARARGTRTRTGPSNFKGLRLKSGRFLSHVCPTSSFGETDGGSCGSSVLHHPLPCFFGPYPVTRWSSGRLRIGSRPRSLFCVTRSVGSPFVQAGKSLPLGNRDLGRCDSRATAAALACGKGFTPAPRSLPLRQTSSNVGRLGR